MRRGSCLIAILWWLRSAWRGRHRRQAAGWLTIRLTHKVKLWWLRWPSFGYMEADSPGRTHIRHYVPVRDYSDRYLPPPVFEGEERLGDFDDDDDDIGTGTGI